MLVLLVYLLAVPCNASQLKVHLRYKVTVLFCRDLFAGRFHIDQSSDQARFCIRDLNGLIGAQKHETLELTGILAAELLVHQHGLVGYQRVQPGVVLDAGKVTVVLDRDQRVRFERLQRKRIG